MLARVSAFGQFEAYLDPWVPEYGGELPSERGDAPDDDLDVDPEAELPRARWAPLAPAATDAAAPGLAFVDGVRRIEAHVLLRGGGQVAHAAFGSLGVGAVLCADGRADVAAVRVERVLAIDSGVSLPDAVEVAPGLLYQPLTTSERSPEAPLLRLQEAMRAAEETLASQSAARDDILVVCDGPLRPAAFADGPHAAPQGDPGAAREQGRSAPPLMGFVKRLHTTYLEPELMPVVARLPPGTRTPLFALRAPRRFARLAWYLRLDAPQAGEFDLAGVVRLEVADTLGLGEARRLADLSARLLPRFAPSRGRDPRAPQNLLPIGALESHLRRRMGDPRLARRRLESFLRARPRSTPPPVSAAHAAPSPRGLHVAD
jgi:hypothetical protein